jgi:dTDP-4-dehydrorhamnose reductase
MKAVVTGAGGMLGRALVPALASGGHEAVALTREDADVTRIDGLRRAVHAARPDWVFHLAAFTRVDDCESRSDHAHQVNALGARHAAQVAAEVGAGILVLSTDYVFSGAGTRPYREDDPTGPVSVYGASKLAGEQGARAVNARHLIVRTAWLYGRGGANFVDTILARARAGEALRVVDDQRGSPTSTLDLAPALVRLAESGRYGTYHCTNAGECSWHDLAVHVLRRSGLPAPVARIDSATLARPARRPDYSVMSNLKFEQATGERMPHWQDAVDRYLGHGATALQASEEAR